MSENQESQEKPKPELSESPERHTFFLRGLLQSKIDKGTENEPEFIDHYKRRIEQIAQLREREKSPEWQVDNLEYDLRTTPWILEKVRASEVYSQRLYAALCNNYFIKKHPWNVLTEKSWECSWRHAGGVIADMRQEGDYIQWYCSGSNADYELSEKENNPDTKSASEGEIMPEIRKDLDILGWIVKQ